MRDDALMKAFFLLIIAPWIADIVHHGIRFSRPWLSYQKIRKYCTLASSPKGMSLVLMASMLSLFLHFNHFNESSIVSLGLVNAAILMPPLLVFRNALLPDGVSALILSMATSLLFSYSFFIGVFLKQAEAVNVTARVFLGLAFLSCALLVSRAAPLAIDPEMTYLSGQAKAILTLARAILVVLFFSFTIDLLLPDLSLGVQFLLQCLCAWCLFCFGQLTGNLRMLDVPNFLLIGAAFATLAALLTQL